jgi:iron complex transport system substrate-binding protein
MKNQETFMDKYLGACCIGAGLRQGQRRLIAACFILCIFAGCTPKAIQTFQDRAGNRVSIPELPKRIISTAPSHTEIIHDLGLADKLVAVDRYSAKLYGVKPDIPHIDFFNPDAETIITLNPDIIIVNGRNQTGAGADPFRLLKESGIPVVYIPMSESIEGIMQDIAFIAQILGVEGKGAELIAAMRAEIAAIRAGLPASATEGARPRVYFEISPSPSIVSIGQGTFLDDMIQVIGAENIFGDEKGVIFPSAEAIVDRNPDVMITNINMVADTRGDVREEMDAIKVVEEIKTREGFAYINAVRNNRVYYVDTDSSSRPSNHIMLALRQMADVVYQNHEK